MYILWQEFQNLLKTTLSSFRKKYNFYSPGLNETVINSVYTLKELYTLLD